MELTGDVKEGLKARYMDPKCRIPKPVRVLTVRIRGEEKRMGSRLWDTS